MRRTDLIPPSDPAAWLASSLTRLGLLAKAYDLKKCPGATHWHIKKPGQTGTLEATWWPARGQFWLEQRGDRASPWQDEVIAKLIAES